MAGRVFGVDEAGKGPVLGSMFAAAVYADPAALSDGVADSKRLSPPARERIDAELRASDDIVVGVACVPPARIDDPETDMNTLTVEAHADALATMVEGVPPDALDGGLAGYVDAGETNERRFGERVAARVDAALAVTAEHRADDTYPVVSAASVVAKVARDAHVAALAETYGDVGSGYPGDPTTRSFLREYVRERGELPDCARASWATCADVLAAAEQSSLDSF